MLCATSTPGGITRSMYVQRLLRSGGGSFRNSPRAFAAVEDSLRSCSGRGRSARRPGFTRSFRTFCALGPRLRTSSSSASISKCSARSALRFGASCVGTQPRFASARSTTARLRSCSSTRCIDKLRLWSEEVKHIVDTFPVRVLLTGSSSTLVARGGRESLAGRVFTTELPPFTFREVLECWEPEKAKLLPPALRFSEVFDGALVESCKALEGLRPHQELSLRHSLEKYYNRGGYPRLHSGEVDDDRWADYLVQTIFENVLGADIPDLFPVENPALLRNIYLSVARLSGQEIAQTRPATLASEAGIPANQPTVGKYLRYLADALLIREFRRYPRAKRLSARVPSKITVSDLGVRNAVFRGAPSLWESDPGIIGSLVETVVQGVIRDHNLHVHFFRDHERTGDQRSVIREVDFVAERIDGAIVPIEVKFRKRIDSEDLAGMRHFRSRFKTPFGVVVTRDESRWDPENRLLLVPLLHFLLAF